MGPISGKTIDGYIIGDLLAAGGMGEIYLAAKEDDPELVVMKVVRRDLHENPDLRKRFLREIRLLATLQHENVIPILDWGYKHKVLYYTMKKVDGPTLAELIHTERFTPAAARAILAPLAAALDYIHSQGVMHRDVKPANVLLEPASDHWHVYLSDFGLGKNPQRDRLLPMVSRSMGTVEYMSPESVAKHPADYRTDIYSLTAIAYEMLLGIKPHKVNKNPDGNIIPHVLLLPSLISAEFPYPLESVLIHGMQYNRDWRFQSARAFIDAFDKALCQLTEEQRDTRYQHIFKQNKLLAGKALPTLDKME